MRAVRTLMVAGVLAAHSAVASAQADSSAKKPAPVLAGKWTFTVTSDLGTGTPTVTFAQKGDSLTGHYSSQALGEHDFTGTFKDGKIKFGFSADLQGTAFTMSFAGAFDGDDALKGTIDFGGQASGTFTAARQKPKPPSLP